jgi:hypothetical protein
MAIVDRYYFRERPGMTDEEREAEIRRRIDLKYEIVTKAAFDFQVKKERAIKLRSMKRYLYGKYIVRVPAFNTNRYVDSPLPESFAKPVSSKTAPVVNITGRKYGQILKGDMIPVRELQQEAAESTKTKDTGGKALSFPLRQLKSALGFSRQQQLGKSLPVAAQRQQHPRTVMSSVMRFWDGGGSRQDAPHEKIPLLSTFTRPFQYQTAAAVSPAHVTPTIIEEEDVNHGESSEYGSAVGNSNNDNSTNIIMSSPTMETWVADTTAQNLTVSTDM